MLGLVLTAGGARGAYQAGVLKRIGELPALRRRPLPFQIISGASAGAINGAMLAALSADGHAATRALADLWSTLRVPDVFRADAMTLSLSPAAARRTCGAVCSVLRRYLTHLRWPPEVKVLGGIPRGGSPDHARSGIVARSPKEAVWIPTMRFASSRRP